MLAHLFRPDRDHLEGVHLPVVLADRDIFSRREDFVLQPEAVLVVGIGAFIVVERPLSAGAAQDPAVLLIFAGTKATDATGMMDVRPGLAVDPAIRQQRQIEVIAVVSVPQRVSGFTCKFELDV